MVKKVPKCQFKGCNDKCTPRDLYCHSHAHKVTISRFLSRVYTQMKSRISGKNTKRPDLYKGKDIVSKEVFIIWSRNHPEFLRLYKVWVNCNFDTEFTPTVNRITSTRGYSLENMEWVTKSQNSSLARAVRHLNHKKEIYRLLGVRE